MHTLVYAKRLARKLLEDKDNPEDPQLQFTTVENIEKKGATNEIRAHYKQRR